MALKLSEKKLMLEIIKNDKNVNDKRMKLLLENTVEIIWKSFGNELRSVDNNCLLFIDPIVLSNNQYILDLENESCNLKLIPTNINEHTKSSESLISILTVFENEGVGRRNTNIYAVGGGVLLDVVSMACSIYRRGVDVIKVPTTLLAMVDASIGVKTGINFLGQRNRIGTYNINYDVILDSSLLNNNPSLTLQGMGEVIKIAIIKSKKLFELIENNIQDILKINFFETLVGEKIIDLSINLMLEELHNNPREINLKRCVDFGHTFSPLVEMQAIENNKYRNIPHGFAVGYDCLLTAKLSLNRGILSITDFARINNLFKKLDMDFENHVYDDNLLLWYSLLEMTKHRGGNQNLPIPTEIGQHHFISDVTYDELCIANNELRAQFN